MDQLASVAIKPTRQLGLLFFPDYRAYKRFRYFNANKKSHCHDIKTLFLPMLTFFYSETLPKQPQGFNVEAVNDTSVRYKGHLQS